MKKHARGDIYMAVAKSYHKLLAIKDEYEVARLYTNGDFLNKLNAQFDGNFKLKFHMTPPIFEKRHKVTGEVQKREFGPWMMAALKLVAKFKFLRGSAFDIFAYSAERKMERAIIKEYENHVQIVLDKMNKDNYQLCRQILEMPMSYKGYGHVKERNIEGAKAKLEKLLAELDQKIDLREAS